ncbi:TPA: hypothetical protein HA246_06520 [Candidatus Woesearchaeota archaeon]|nr:hypothetical protein [Candidatus Woesearchaeota archaeon]HIH43268.1 hypothetical protein [Candidatus Woesearchaeota archaeon]
MVVDDKVIEEQGFNERMFIGANLERLYGIYGRRVLIRHGPIAPKYTSGEDIVGVLKPGDDYDSCRLAYVDRDGTVRHRFYYSKDLSVVEPEPGDVFLQARAVITDQPIRQASGLVPQSFTNAFVKLGLYTAGIRDFYGGTVFDRPFDRQL